MRKWFSKIFNISKHLNFKLTDTFTYKYKFLSSFIFPDFAISVNDLLMNFMDGFLQEMDRNSYYHVISEIKLLLYI